MLQQSIWLRRLIIASRPCPLNGKKFSVNTKFCIHHHHHCHYKHHHHHHHHEESASNVAKFLHPPLRPPKSGKSPLHDFFFGGGGWRLYFSVTTLKKQKSAGDFLSNLFEISKIRDAMIKKFLLISSLASILGMSSQH